MPGDAHGRQRLHGAGRFLRRRTDDGAMPRRTPGAGGKVGIAVRRKRTFGAQACLKPAKSRDSEGNGRLSCLLPSAVPGCVHDRLLRSARGAGLAEFVRHYFFGQAACGVRARIAGLRTPEAAARSALRADLLAVANTKIIEPLGLGGPQLPLRRPAAEAALLCRLRPRKAGYV